MEAASVEHLRYQAAIGQGDLVTDAELPGRGREQFLDGAESSGDPMLGPFLLLLLADVDQHDQVLKWLDAGGDDLEMGKWIVSFVEWSSNSDCQIPRISPEPWHASGRPAAEEDAGDASLPGSA